MWKMQHFSFLFFFSSLVQPEPSNVKRELPLLFQKWNVRCLQVLVIRKRPGMVIVHVRNLF